MSITDAQLALGHMAFKGYILNNAFKFKRNRGGVYVEIGLPPSRVGRTTTMSLMDHFTDAADTRRVNLSHVTMYFRATANPAIFHFYMED